MGPRHPHRNAQFENIARLKQEYLSVGLPVISMDTKKKELLGNFHRDGKIDTQQTIETNDHDFGSAGAGVVIPHALYDVGRNKGFVHLNTSHDTSELACDSIAAWWEQQGRADYPEAKKLLLLCDGGGSNSATRYVRGFPRTEIRQSSDKCLQLKLVGETVKSLTNFSLI